MKSRWLRARCPVFLWVVGGLSADCAASDDVAQPAPEIADVFVPTPDAGATDARLSDASPNQGSDASRDAGTCTSEGWCSTNVPLLDERQTRTNILSLWSDGQGSAWATAVGNDSVERDALSTYPFGILRWDGAQWVRAFRVDAKYNGFSLAPSAMWGSGPTDIWAFVGRTMYHGTGATAATVTWQDVSPAGGEVWKTVTSLGGSGPDDVWAVGGGDVWHYLGATPGWVKQTPPPHSGPFRSVQVIQGVVWLGGGESITFGKGFLIYHNRADGGDAWTPITLPRVRSRELTGLPPGAPIVLPGVVGFGVATSGEVWVAAHTDKDGFVLRGEVIGGAFEVSGGWSPPAETTTAAQLIDGVMYTIGSGRGAVTATSSEGPSIERISAAPIPNPGPFTAVYGTSASDIWVGGYNCLLHKGLMRSP